jgi:ATP-dependent RNA helicase RhlE
MKFDQYDISDELKENLIELAWKKPTDIQYKSIPAVLKGEDVLAIAQTGTGKTAAFAIPVIHRIQQKKRKDRPDGVRCLVMVPTHELAQQLEKVFSSLSKNTGVTTYCIHGGLDQDPQIKRLSKGVDILITTPGRMFDLVSQEHLLLHRLNTLILDEADHMLDLGFIKDIKDLMRLIPKRRQTLFFSATINDRIKKLAYSIVNNPIRIQVSPKDPVTKSVKHKVTFVEMDDKRYLLERVLTENPDNKILIFVRTKVRAERVKKAMERVDIETMTIHSDKTEEERSKTMNLFRSGEQKVLIATDISARGIDIPNVDVVINYDLPDQPENYVHRVGRTGRGNLTGWALAFCSKDEREYLQAIEGFMGKEVEVLNMGKEDLEDTLEMSAEKKQYWKTLLKDEEAFLLQKKLSKRKKKK